MRSWRPMLRSERGLRRPCVFLALLWIGFLGLLTAMGLPLRRPEAAEKLLAETEAVRREADGPLKEADGLEGTLTGRLREVTVNAGGHYSLTVGEAFFAPSGTEDSFAAGTVLVYFPQNCELKPGYTVRFRGRLCFFREAENPGAFDARAYYLSLDMACCMDAQALQIEESKVYPVREAARQLRNYLREGLEAVFPAEEAGLLSAMLLGDRSGIGEDMQSAYETAGLSHLLSVSGLHVSFWALVIGRIFGFLLSFFPFSRGTGRLSRFGFSFLKGILAAAAVLFYMLLSGGRVPVRRAGLMVLLLQLARALRLSYDLPSALSLAALSILIPYPYALFQASFQLSFGCVLILGCLLPFLIEKLHCEALLSQSLLVPVTLQMGTLPLSLYHTFCFHPYSVLANLLILPFVGLILAGGMAAALLVHLSRPAGLIAGGGVHLLLEGIGWACRLIGSAPFHTVVLGRPKLWQSLVFLFLSVCGLLFLIHLRKREREAQQLSLWEEKKQTPKKMLTETRRTALILFFWLLGVGTVFLINRPGDLRLSALSVGQGDSHLIRLPDGKAYLMDCGTSFGEDPGTETVLPALRFYGIRRLEYILVSHCDSDHMNGIETLLSEPSLKIGGLILSGAYQGSSRTLTLVQAAKKREIPVYYAGDGVSWQDGDVRFDILYPDMTPQKDPGNESSLVLKLSRGSFSALYTGDLGSQGEALLLARHREDLRDLTCLKVGHHGSRYSSTAVFLRCLSPDYALISCGRNNFYGHPAAETIVRLKAAGAEILRTDRDGAAELSVSENGEITVQKYHNQEDLRMSIKKEDKITRGTWICCGIIIGIGVLALCLAFRGPKKSAESSAAGSSQEISIGSTGQAGEENTTVLPAPSGTSYYTPKTDTEAETWPDVLPPAHETVPLSALPSRDFQANGGRLTEGEDPLAPGFFFSEELTDRLYTLFASELTNNTREDDPFRGISAELKEKMDGISLRFTAGKISAETLQEEMRGLSFSWPNDPYQLVHEVGTVSARIYAYAGTDMDFAKERIVMTNQAGRHYLFLRVYVNETAGLVRIYMVNALIY